MDIEKLMRVGEAANRTGKARTTILAAIGRGEIPAYRAVCGLPMVRLSDVKKWRSARKPGRPFAQK